MAQARAAARHLAHIRGGAIPPLLKSRIDDVLSELQKTPVGARVRRALSCGDLRGCPNCQRRAGSRRVERSARTVSSTRGRERGARSRSGRRFAVTRTPSASASSDGITSAPRLFAASGPAGEATARRSIDIGQIHSPGAGRQLDRGRRAHSVPRSHHWRRGDALEHRWTRERRAGAGVRRGGRSRLRPARVRAGRAPGRARESGCGIRSRRRQPGNRRGAEGDRARGQRAVHGASRRGKRIGQGAGGARHSSGRVPPRAPLLRVQLRRDARRPRRCGAVRPCEGCVHGCCGRAARPVRERRWRYGLSRRSR